jgi:nicotinate-nucleotide adenylyltransferase
LIGILGGTFAPVHNGHLRLAIEARDQLGLGEIRFIPAASPPLRARPAIPAKRRLRWVELAIEGEPGLVADDRELRRRGPSYTFDTLTELRKAFPRAPLLLLLGEDAGRQLPRWHRWKSLVELAHLVFFNRPGHDATLAAPVANLLRKRQALSAEHLAASPSGLWWRGGMTPMAISASDVRMRLRDGYSVRGLVPDRVIDDFTPNDLKAFRREDGSK